MMSKAVAGRLTSLWRIPLYAQDMLWLESESATVPIQGEQGHFELEVPAQVVTIRWGAAGPALAQVRWRQDSLNWSGTVRIGGFIDALHLIENPSLPGQRAGVLFVGGQPLKPDVSEYPKAYERRSVPYPAPSYWESLADDVHETITTWLVPEDSPTLMIAQDALVSKLHVLCFGALAPQESGWHKGFALPVMLEGITLFAP